MLEVVGQSTPRRVIANVGRSTTEPQSPQVNRVLNALLPFDVKLRARPRMNVSEEFGPKLNSLCLPDANDWRRGMNWTPYYAVSALLWLIAWPLGFWYFAMRRTRDQPPRRPSLSRRICLITAMIAVPVLYHLSYPLCIRLVAADSKNAGTIDCAIEIQISVRSEPYKPGDVIKDGDFFVVSSNVFPIHSTGGAGHVVGNSNGVIMEVEWDAVRLLERRHDQHHSPEKQIVFDNFRFHIKNPIVLPNGSSYPKGISSGGEPRTALLTEFDLPFAMVPFGPSLEKNERALVIRARLLPKIEPAKPLTIPLTPDVAT